MLHACGSAWCRLSLLERNKHTETNVCDNGSVMILKKQSKKRDCHNKNEDWKQYKNWRNQIIKLKRVNKKECFSKAVQENKDTSYLWRHVKNKCNTPDESSLPDELSTGNRNFNNHSDVIHNLNAFFANISEHLQQNTNVTRHDLQYNPGKLNDHVKSRIPENLQFKIPKIKLPDLICILKSLDVTKATGLYGLSPRILKLAADVIAPSLLTMINRSFQTGHSLIFSS